MILKQHENVYGLKFHSMNGATSSWLYQIFYNNNQGIFWPHLRTREKKNNHIICSTLHDFWEHAKIVARHSLPVHWTTSHIIQSKHTQKKVFDNNNKSVNRNYAFPKIIFMRCCSSNWDTVELIFYERWFVCAAVVSCKCCLISFAC